METKRKIRSVLAGVAVLAGSTLLFAACGGGSSTAGSEAVGSAVRVSLSSASREPVDSASSADPASPQGPVSPNVEAVTIAIERMALIPGWGCGGISPAGSEFFEYGSEAASRNSRAGIVVKSLDAPVAVDLLGLPDGGPVRLPNPFDDVPPGTYGKIRLYFSELSVTVDGVTLNVKPKGGFHLDVLFKDGGLVIPEGGAGGTQDIVVCIVPGTYGIKVEVRRNPATGAVVGVRVRPVVFATISRDLPSSVAGTVESADAVHGIFTVQSGTDGATVPVEYDLQTRWSFRDGDTVVAVPPELGQAAVRAGASVDVIGVAGAVMRADEVILSFPVAYVGVVTSGSNESGWNGPDFASFEMWHAGFRTVVPLPGRTTAFYDNTVPVDPPLDEAIVFFRNVKVRGYEDTTAGTVEAFWITIGDLQSQVPM